MNSRNRKLTKGRVKASTAYGRPNPLNVHLKKQKESQQERRRKDNICLAARNFGESEEDYRRRKQMTITT